jgi:hypothetical protein
MDADALSFDHIVKVVASSRQEDPSHASDRATILLAAIGKPLESLNGSGELGGKQSRGFRAVRFPPGVGGNGESGGFRRENDLV